MQRRNIIIAVAVVVVAMGWYAFRPERLFVDKTVSEALPAVAAASGQVQQAGGNVSSTAEPSSASVAARVSMGRFRSGAHETQGLATIYELGGKRVLRLTEFATSNGPDVHVYLVAAPDVTNEATVKQAGFVDLGSIKGNRGDQNYDIPAGVDLAKYRTATIWCKRFSVNFGSAPLSGS